MRPRRWTLARSLALRFALSTLLLLAGVAGLSAWYLEQSVRRELESLAREELDEMRVLVSLQAPSREDFARLVSDLASQHLEVPVAWRVWEGSGNLWGEFGATVLLGQTPPPDSPPRETRWLGSARTWRVEDLRHGLRAGVLLDGREPLALLRRYQMFALTLLGIGTVLSLAGGALFGRRMARLLEQVAAGVRAVRNPEQELALELGSAPEEIRGVAEALRGMLAGIRREAERARLLTAGMAHELRSPIQNLLGETEVALLRERSSEEYRAVLESHLEDLRDLTRVVDNLVLLCAPGQPAEPGREAAFDLGREAELRLERQADQARRHGVRLALERQGDLVLRGDREALLLALENLVGNAVQWSPPGGQVEVTLDGGADSIVVLVDDQGPGVPPSERERVFEPFYRSPAPAGRRVGYGLGLALARAAAAAQGGKIGIEVSSAGGARLRMVLPRRQGSADQVHAA